MESLGDQAIRENTRTCNSYLCHDSVIA